LFSRKEIVHLVRKFILAYIRGEITFDLVIKPETYKRRLEMDGRSRNPENKRRFAIAVR
jgi:hypothetical protein